MPTSHKHPSFRIITDWDQVLCTCTDYCSKVECEVLNPTNIPLEGFEDLARYTCNNLAIIKMTLTNNLPCAKGLAETFLKAFDKIDEFQGVELVLISLTKDPHFEGSRCNALLKLLEEFTQQKLIRWKYAVAYERTLTLTITLEPIGIFELSS